MPFVTDEVVTAAKLNMATVIASSHSVSDDRTFTNTAYADLDALTGGSGTIGARIVTVSTGTSAMVTVQGVLSVTAGVVLVAVRVSGASTVTATALENVSARTASTSLVTICSRFPVALTAGSNVFELQARVTAGTGRLLAPVLVVEGIV